MLPRPVSLVRKVDSSILSGKVSAGGNGAHPDSWPHARVEVVLERLSLD